MCKTISDDDGCESCTQYCVCYGLDDATDNDIIEAIEAVEKWAVEHPQWAVEHPQETRWTKLKKVCPVLNDNARKQICVRAFGYQCDCDLDCAKHWDVPVEE